MLKIMLSGANGKMGHTIARLVGENPNCEIVAGVDLNTDRYDKFPIYKCAEESGVTPDVIIDFSHPSALDGILSYAKKHKVGIVVATTGLSPAAIESVKAAGAEIPVFYSANMSIGINLLLELCSRAAALLEGNFDIEIVERHHNQKIDAPSGTALMLADAMSSALKMTPEYVYDRHSVRKKREPNEIGIHAVRGGSIVGEHEVIFAGQDEVIEIKHQATSKEVFAVGAVRAAQYIANKTPGLYNMQNLVNGD